MNKNLKIGFTLLEILVVIAIIGILSVSALSAYQYFISRYKLKTSAKTLTDTIFYAGYYSNFFKKKTAVKLYYYKDCLYANVISYESESDPKVINKINIGENLMINPLNDGAGAYLPEIYFNKNYAISGKAEIRYPSYYVSESIIGKCVPLILVTLRPAFDPKLKINKNKYASIQFFEESGRTVLHQSGFENNKYFKD